MALVRGVHCCAWVTLAILLYGTPANSDSEVAATLGHLGDRLSVTQPNAVSISEHVKVPLAGQNVPSASADGPVSTGPFDAARAALADANVTVAFADSNSQVI